MIRPEDHIKIISFLDEEMEDMERLAFEKRLHEEPDLHEVRVQYMELRLGIIEEGKKQDQVLLASLENQYEAFQQGHLNGDMEPEQNSGKKGNHRVLWLWLLSLLVLLTLLTIAIFHFGSYANEHKRAPKPPQFQAPIDEPGKIQSPSITPDDSDRKGKNGNDKIDPTYPKPRKEPVDHDSIRLVMFAEAFVPYQGYQVKKGQGDSLTGRAIYYYKSEQYPKAFEAYQRLMSDGVGGDTTRFYFANTALVLGYSDEALSGLAEIKSNTYSIYVDWYRAMALLLQPGPEKSGACEQVLRTIVENKKFNHELAEKLLDTFR